MIHHQSVAARRQSAAEKKPDDGRADAADYIDVGLKITTYDDTRLAAGHDCR